MRLNFDRLSKTFCRLWCSFVRFSLFSSFFCTTHFIDSIAWMDSEWGNFRNHPNGSRVLFGNLFHMPADLRPTVCPYSKSFRFSILMNRYFCHFINKLCAAIRKQNAFSSPSFCFCNFSNCIWILFRHKRGVVRLFIVWQHSMEPKNDKWFKNGISMRQYNIRLHLLKP